MHSSAYLVAIAAVGGVLLLASLCSGAALFLKKRSFILQTRAPHILALHCAWTAVTVCVWAAEEARFAVQGGAAPWSRADDAADAVSIAAQQARRVSAHLLALYSHLFVAVGVLPLLWRALQLQVMFDPQLRKRYVRWMRRRATLATLACAALLLGVVPFVAHVLAAPEQFRFTSTGADPHALPLRMFAEWRYFLPLFCVCICIQLVQLRKLRALDDSLGIIAELRGTLRATVLFSIGFFTWSICIDNDVRASGIDDGDMRWMRCNHAVLVMQLALWARTLLRPLIEVRRHTQQVQAALRAAEEAAYGSPLDHASSRWMRPRNAKIAGTVGGGGDANQSGHGSPNRSRDSSPRGSRTTNLKGSTAQSTRTSGNRQGSDKGGVIGTALQACPPSPSAHSPAWSIQPVAEDEAGGGGVGVGGGGVQMTKPAPSAAPPKTVGHKRGGPTKGPGSLDGLHAYARPSPDAKLKSLHDIFLYAPSAALFEDFARKHLCIESFLFWQVVQEYESHPAWKNDLQAVYSFGCSIYSSFVASGSELETNLPGDIRARIKKVFGSNNSSATAAAAAAAARGQDKNSNAAKEKQKKYSPLRLGVNKIAAAVGNSIGSSSGAATPRAAGGAESGGAAAAAGGNGPSAVSVVVHLASAKGKGAAAASAVAAANKPSWVTQGSGSKKAGASSPVTGGRFESFLSIPSAQRRLLFRPAQDDVYALLKVNLLLPFCNTPEFGNVKRRFEKEREVARNAAKALAATKAQQQQLLQVQVQVQASSGGHVHAHPAVPGTPERERPQYLKTPSGRCSSPTFPGSAHASPVPSPSRLVQMRIATANAPVAAAAAAAGAAAGAGSASASGSDEGAAAMATALMRLGSITTSSPHAPSDGASGAVTPEPLVLDRHHHPLGVLRASTVDDDSFATSAGGGAFAGGMVISPPSGAAAVGAGLVATPPPSSPAAGLLQVQGTSSAPSSRGTSPTVSPNPLLRHLQSGGGGSVSGLVRPSSRENSANSHRGTGSPAQHAFVELAATTPDGGGPRSLHLPLLEDVLELGEGSAVTSESPPPLSPPANAPSSTTSSC